MKTKNAVIVSILVTLFFVAHLFPPADSLIFSTHNECLMLTPIGYYCIFYFHFILFVLLPSLVYATCKSINTDYTFSENCNYMEKNKSYFGIPNRPILSIIINIVNATIFYVSLFIVDIFEPNNCPHAELTIYGQIYIVLLSIALPVSSVIGFSSFFNILFRVKRYLKHEK